MTLRLDKDLVTGGNVDQVTKRWTWINVSGPTAADWHYWFQKGIEQGVKIVEGTYDYDRRAKRLRCLNLKISGPRDAVNSLHSIIETLAGHKTPQ